MSEVPLTESLYDAQVYSGEHLPPLAGYPVRTAYFLALGPVTPVLTFRPMAVQAVYHPILNWFRTNDLPMFTALDAMMVVEPNWEDEFNPLHDVGIEFAQTPLNQVATLVNHWNAPVLVFDVNLAVANNHRMDENAVYTLVNMTMKTILSPTRSISRRLMANLRVLWLQWTNNAQTEFVMLAVGAVGTTYFEYLPHFMTLVQSYPAGRLLM
jgi:hypothetical protein